MANSRRRGPFFAALGVIASLAFGPAAQATPPSFIDDSRYASIVVDAASGRVLASANPDQALHPASLTKIMTLFMTFDALKRGQLQLWQVLPVSAHAAAMTPTELKLKAGDKITVEQAILGLVTESANDAAVVLAEAQAASEEAFAEAMTQRARSIGMKQTVFVNASGLPDVRQVSTARDQALLAMALMREHANEYRYFSTYRFAYRGQTYFNHNRLLNLYKGADGIKTGFIRAAGYNLVASAHRDGQRVIGVVFGGSSGRARDAHMVTLLDKGFNCLRSGTGEDGLVTAEVALPKPPSRFAATAAFDFKEGMQAGGDIAEGDAAAPAPEPRRKPAAAAAPAKTESKTAARTKPAAPRRKGLQTVAFR
jgi:D-alanyl-D-alanine carboxypeptidase